MSEEINNLVNNTAEAIAPAEMTTEQVAVLLQELMNQLEELKKGGNTTKKNQQPSKAHAGRKSVLLSKTLESWGRIPQQQLDIATILAANFEVNKEYSESEVFNAITTDASYYNSLANSRQDPTYLFRYYRGLADNGKHAGFIARNFMRVIG